MLFLVYGISLLVSFAGTYDFVITDGVINEVFFHYKLTQFL